MASTSRAKRTLEKGENSISKYAKSGSSDSFHGTIYHVKLMMLFIVRAYIKESNFEIACEVKHAEKLDDIVYINLNDEKFITFLQAKHKKEERPKQMKIDFKDLVTMSDYYLITYFESYKHIKQCREFGNCEIEELVIATNLKLATNLTSLFEKADDINDLGNGIHFSKFKNSDSHNDNYEKIKTLLLNYDELSEIAKKLAAKFNDEKKIVKNNQRLHTFYKPLTKDVLEISEDVWKFQHAFITSEKEVHKKFREEFMKYAKTNDINEVTFKILNDFTKEENCKTCSNHYEELPVPFRDRQLVEDFLKKFRFYETPNEDIFKNILKNELEKIDIFRNKNIESVYCRFYENILEWFKSVDNEGRAEKKNSKDIKKFFEVLSKEC